MSSQSSLYESWQKKVKLTPALQQGFFTGNKAVENNPAPPSYIPNIVVNVNILKIILSWVEAQTICALAMIFQTHVCWWNLQDFGYTQRLVQWWFFWLLSYYYLMGDTENKLLKLKPKVKVKIFFRQTALSPSPKDCFKTRVLCCFSNPYSWSAKAAVS